MRRAWVWIVLVLGLGLSACVADTGESAEGLPQGLTVLEAEEGALSLAYRSADVVIYMEALRGQPTPDVYQDAPGSPNYEVDALFTDDAGFVFYSQQGGDGFVDSSWSETVQAQRAMRPPADSNEVLYRLAGEAALVMHDEIESQIGPELAAALGPEISAIYLFAVQAPDVYAEQLEGMNAERRAQGLPTVEPTGDVVYGSGGPEDSRHDNGAGRYKLDLHHGHISYVGVSAKHSATVLYRLEGNSWVTTHAMCNHGDCALSMNKKCGFSARDLVYARQNTCTGDYKWDSDTGDHGHNCHDDSRVQMHNFRWDSNMGRTNRWCNGNDDDTDISIDVWGIELDQEGSPSCNNDGHRGYGWDP